MGTRVRETPKDCKLATIDRSLVGTDGYGITHAKVLEAIRRSNQETGGAVVELAETEYIVRAKGYLASLDDFRNIPLSASTTGGGRAAGRCRPHPGGPGDAARYR